MNRHLLSPSRCFALLVVLVLSAILSSVSLAQGSTGTIERVSVSSAGAEADSISYLPAITPDGRTIAFQSEASNLVTGDTNWVHDIFVRDRQSGVTTRVSVSSSGIESNEMSDRPSISSDGRYVAFYSYASNLVANDTNEAYDVFVHDRQTGQTTRVSVSSAGAQGNAPSFQPALSYDGRYVVFYSDASNLVDGDTNNKDDVFVHDRQNGQTTRVSVNSAGEQGNSDSYICDISGDGRYVAFHSWASNLVTGDSNNTGDVFVRDLVDNQTTRVSLSSSGDQGNASSSFPSISSDGRYVAFWSAANGLIDQDDNGWQDIFVHDRQTGQTTSVSVTAAGATGNGSSYRPAISDDGRYVAFESYANDLVTGDTTFSSTDMFVRDRQMGQTKRLSVSSAGAQGNGFSGMAAISPDGRYVAFSSGASNLIANDTNQVDDIFLHDRDGIAGGPSVTGFSPTSGPVGTNVTITGENFTGATAVTFNGASQPTFTVNPAGTQITAAVPAGATTGKIAVTTPVSTATSASDFTVILAPAITGFSPASGPVGTSVTISGTNLTGATVVKFNGVNAPSFTVNSATQITAAVPANATTGPIAVTTPGGTAASATHFTVTTPAPTITSFAPTSGPVGTSVTISGTNLTGATSVKFNGVNQPAYTVNAGGTQITAAVPATATTGPIAVTTLGGTATSSTNFTVTAAVPPIYLSLTGNGNVGGKAVTSADIISYAKSSNTWDVLYDGSAINTTKNLGTFAFDGSTILLGFSAPQVVPGLGATAVPPQDLVRFTPTSLGYNATAGTFALFFDGSDVGLTTSAEIIDALWIDANDRLYISTAGTAKVNGAGGAVITAHDEDVLRFTPTSTGATTAGTWSLYWNPTAMTGMSAEDINGYWENPATGHRYVTILGAFNVGNVAYGGKFAGNGKTILRFAPNAAAPGGWAPAEKPVWLATGATFPSNLDGIEMAR